MPRPNNRSPFGPEWRDAFGNSFEALVRSAIANICNAEPGPFRYDTDYYPLAVINIAVRDMEESRGRKIEKPPRPAMPADLMKKEIEFLNAFGESVTPEMRDNCELARLRVRQIEARHPGTRRSLGIFAEREPALAGGVR
jgi:hypothetical protein